MTTFYLLILLTYIFAVISRITKFKVFKVIFFTSIPIMLILISGLRAGIGDTYFYRHSYSLLDGTFNNFKFVGDFGFNIIQIILYNISSNPQTLIFFTALITNLFNSIIFNKYSSYLELQVYLYITSGYYLVTMNGIRQSLAAAILFACTNILIKGNFKKYLIAVLLVSTIHKSALILIPIYYIVRQEAWSKQMIKLIIASVIGVIFYSELEPILFKLLSNTQYGHYSNFNEGGSSLTRALVNSVPVILAYLKRNELKEKWNQSNIFVNIAVINLVFVTFGIYQWIFNRFTIYFQVYNFILLPYIIKNCFKGKEKRLIYVGLLICYFIFCYREQVIGLNMNYRSVLNLQNIFYK